MHLLDLLHEKNNPSLVMREYGAVFERKFKSTLRHETKKVSKNI